MTETSLPPATADRTLVPKRRKLEILKNLLGPLQTETIIAPSFSDAHHQLGVSNKAPINEALSDWLKENPKQNPDLIKSTKEVHVLMKNKADQLRQSNPDISAAIYEYFSCLESWSRGAELAKNPEAAGLNVTPLELALLMQNDGVGCQTIMIRGDKGEILFGHSEEDDTKTRVRHNIWTTFEITGNNPETLSAYTAYKDLLPGPAFCKTPHGLMASDVIFPQTNNKLGFLGNTVTWILWRMGEEKRNEEIVSKLLPILGGYALNTAYAENGQVIGEVIEFADNQISVSRVGENPGDHSLHTNLISNENLNLKALEDLSPKDRGFFSRRIHTLSTILNAIKGRNYHNFPYPSDSLKKILGFRGTSNEQRKLQAVESDWRRATITGVIQPDGVVSQDIQSGPLLLGKNPSLPAESTN